MMDDLRSEIIALRGTNSVLWAQIAEINDAGNQKLDENASTSSSRQRIEVLTKANAQLEQEVSVLCEQLKKFEIDRAEDLAGIQSDHDRVIKEREMLLDAMIEAMEEKDKVCQEERMVFKGKIAQLEELHNADTLRFKEELKRMQESHHKDLSTLNDSLKAAQLAHEEETARLNEELDIVKNERNTLVRKLRRLARQDEVSRSDARNTVRSLRKDEMTATRDVVPTKRGGEERNSHPWAAKPTWVKQGSFWVKNE
jgi:hypothetical protein